MEIPVKLPSRSYGLKLFVVCALVLVMAIPAMFISYISFERSNRADEVTREVSQRYGGEQYVMGPILSIPYHVTKGDKITETGDYIIFPEKGQANFSQVDVDIKKRSLFKVPVYHAKGTLSAEFSPINRKSFETSRNMNWNQARILIAITDGRGLKDDIYLEHGLKKIKFEPAFAKGQIGGSSGNYVFAKEATKHTFFEDRMSGTFLSVPAAPLLKNGTPLKVSAKLSLGGASNLSIYPFAKSTRVEMKSPWPTPGFHGAFPPTQHDITPEGFTAKWSVPYLARGIVGEGPGQSLNMFSGRDKAMTVKFVSSLDPYRTVNRSLKYAVMFIGLVFIAFFMFEVMIGKPVHPAQYVLIGLAQSIFYLLLLAFSEQIGFGGAFLISSIATVGLTALYAGWTFGGRQYAIRAGVVFTLTYGLLYSLMRMQDFALMIGALSSFMAIALVMYLTRNMDWYGGKSEVKLGDPSRSPLEPHPTNTGSRI